MDLNSLLITDRHLPSLWNKSLVSRDFFESHTNEQSCDIVIGNPPWANVKRSGQKAAIRWSEKNGYPLPGNELAWTFAWKAMRHLNIGGLVAFLLPAMTFLHNQTGTSIEARERLFDEFRVQVVADLSDLRQQLFADARHPAAIMIFRKPTRGKESSYIFDYLVPKSGPNLTVTRFVSLTPKDRHRLNSSDVAKNSRILKERLWLQPSESNLFHYLSGLPTLGDFMNERFDDCSTDHWRIGRGFEAWYQGRSGKSSGSSVVGYIPHIPTEKLTPLRIDAMRLDPWNTSTVRRHCLESGFRNTRILVKTGIANSKGRLLSAYVEQPMSFNNSIIAITVPLERRDAAKFITAYLNSRLAIWFAFHGTVALGARRPRLNQRELLRLPLPWPEDLAHPDRAREARDELTRVVDEFVPSDSNDPEPSRSEDDCLLRIDRLTYDYFGLNDDEITVVDETVKYTLPAVHPTPNGFPELWKRAPLEERKAYADTLRGRIAGWLIESRPPTVRLLASNKDFSIVELSIEQTSGPSRYKEESGTRFATALNNLSERLGQPVSGNFLLTPDVRVFLGQKLYLIKPLQRRFWLRSAALGDADNIAMDLEALWRKNQDSGSPA